MKIVSWNCNGALRKKFRALQALDVDICVIQECENPAESQDDAYRDWAQNHLWVGRNRHKGLGVFAKPQIKLTRRRWWDHGLELFLPCRIGDEFDLLAVWTKQGRLREQAYIGQMGEYLRRHRRKIAGGDILLAGDFNSNSRWDSPRRAWNHSDVVAGLGAMGITSVYHALRGEEHGAEGEPTFYLYKDLAKDYHIDYFFASAELLPTFTDIELGTPSEWLPRSDHVPIIAAAVATL